LRKQGRDWTEQFLPFFKRHCAPLFFKELFAGATRASRAKDFQTAAEIALLLLQHAPRHPELHHLLGVVRGRAGDQEQAIAHLRQAIALQPKAPAYHFNLAEAYRRQASYPLAEKSYLHALRLAPQLVEARVGLAKLRHEQGRFDQALAGYRQALQIKADHLAAHNGMGLVSFSQGDYAAAEDCYKRALALSPSFTEAAFNLGVLYNARARPDKAAEYFQQALAVRPDWLEARKNLAMMAERQGLIDDARAHYQRLLDAEPENLLLALRQRSVFPPVAPDTPAIGAFRQDLLAHLQQWQESATLTLDLSDLHSSGCEPPLCLAYQGLDDKPLKTAWAELFAAHLALPSREPKARRGRRPRIGCVVTRQHEGVFLKAMGGLWNRLSSARFDLTLICSRQGGKAALQRGISNPGVAYLTLSERIDESARQIAEADFDLLYYWEVGTDSGNYFLPFFRLARVQCTGWGWPVTSGIATMDYYLSSEHLETPGSDAHYSEQLVRFKHLPAFIQRLPELPGDKSAFGVDKTQPLYVCAQNLRKFHPDFDPLLADILRRDRQAVIVLVEDPQPAVTAALRRRLCAQMPDVFERLRFIAKLKHADYLALLASADVLLDTPHFAGGVTTYDAIAMGAPLITLPGEFSRGRYAYAAYRQMGLDDGIARNAEDYVERAVRCAGDSDYRAAWRNRLRQASDALFETQDSVSEFSDFIERVLA
jgi:protein O-GlcNAc transferase